jgi:hypothetical protein
MLKLRTAERQEGELRVRVYELHPSYTLRIVQGLIDRVIELARAGKPESFKLMLTNRNRLEIQSEEFARLETLAVMDEALSAPPLPDSGEGAEF